MNISSTNSVSGSSPSADPFQAVAKQHDLAAFLAANVAKTGPTTQSAGASGTHGDHSGSKRLRAFAKQIASRLQNALQSTELNDRQRSAVVEQVSHYRQLLHRLENAYLPGHGQGGDSVQSIEQGLNNVSSTLTQILAPATPTSVNPTDVTSTGTGGLDTVA
jgi:hypothetical protein